ncbi:MAG: hypothetical protein LBS64_00185, partial [Spirochaetaceae bacterium]|nr:hypothetical protein [Spirochaetaceae bacterium]
MEAKTVKNLSAALFCILIFALTTLVGGLTFYYRRGMENADRIFLTLSEKISSLSPAAEELPAETVKSLDEYRYLNSNLAAVSVRLNNKLVYISPVSSPHFAIAPDGTPLMNAPAPFLKQTVRTFTVAGQTIELAAITHILQVQEVLKPARI